MLTFLKSFTFAFNGLRFAWRGRNFRVQSGMALAVIAAGFLLDITSTHWLVIILMIGLVLSFEVFNTAIETVVNFISPEFHPLAGKIKDLAAGAVLILAFTSVVVGLLVFIPYVLPLLNI